MKASADAVQDIKRYLMDKCYWTRGGLEVSLPDPLLPIGDAPGDAAPEAAAEEPPPAPAQVDFPTFDIDINIEIHRNFAQWSKIPPQALGQHPPLDRPCGLQHEGIKVLRNLCSKDQKVPPREKLLELLEFITGMDPSNDIGESRTTGSLATLARARNASLGKRGKELVAPVDWQEVGVYRLSVQAGVVQILKFGIPAPVAIPSDLEPSSLYIKMNSSESRATLSSTMDLAMSRLRVLLHTNGLVMSQEEPAFKYRKLSDSSRGKSSVSTKLPELKRKCGWQWREPGRCKQLRFLGQPFG